MNEKKITLASKFESENAGFKRIFTYYKPQWMIIIMVLVATLNAGGLPSIAIFIIELQYTYYSKLTNDDWEMEAVTLLLLFWTTIAVLSCILSLEKIIFAVMGEKLTKRLRMSLLEEIMHK